jgi:hypothetical protein
MGVNSNAILAMDWVLPAMIICVLYLMYYHFTTVRKTMKTLNSSGALEGMCNDGGYANRFRGGFRTGSAGGSPTGGTTGFDLSGSGSVGCSTGGQKKSNFLGGGASPEMSIPGHAPSVRASRRVDPNTYKVLADGTVTATRNEGFINEGNINEGEVGAPQMQMEGFYSGMKEDMYIEQNGLPVEPFSGGMLSAY